MSKSKTTGSPKKGSSKANKSSKSSRSGFYRFILKLFSVFLVIALFLLVMLDIQVVSKFDGKKWSVPAKVYASALELFEGGELSLNHLVEELERLHYQASYTAKEPGYYRVKSRQVIELQSRGFQFWDGEEPSRRVSLEFAGNQLKSIRGIDGFSTPDILRLEPQLIGGIYPSHNEDRILVKLEQVPELLKNTLIAVEDRGFYSHHGVSLRGIARAVFVNVSTGAFRQGGSTLTQQLVKNFYLTSERTLSRKAIEAVMSILLEFHYTKDEILQAYINEVYLGQSGELAIHGFGLASQHYFGRPLQELKAHHVALLVGMVKGASWYNPRRHPERAKERRDQVLEIMMMQNIISREAYNQSIIKPLGIISKAKSGPSYPAFLDLVRRQLRRDYNDSDLSSEGLRIFTTFDPRVQAAVEASIKATLPRLISSSTGQGTTDVNKLQTAVIVTQPQTAEVLALVGDRSPNFAGFNRALDARRPIGSVVKPAVFLAALHHGYHLASIIDDAAVTVDMPSGAWSPKNFDLESHGPVLMQEALARSYNQATVRLGVSIGVDTVADTIQASSGLPQVPALPSIMLGAIEMAPIEVAAMYQTFASNGFHSPMRAIRAVLTAYGEPLNRYPLSVQQVFDESEIYLLNHGLQQVISNGTGAAVYRQLPPKLRLAGKTGTTDEQRDAWFVGYSGNYLTTVWVGRDDNKPTDLTGSTGALPLWTDIMRRLPLKAVAPLQPEGVDWIWVDAKTGGLSEEGCENAVQIPVFKLQRPDFNAACKRGKKGLPGWLRRLFD